MKKLEKIKAIEMRREGKSYNEIASIIGVSKSTLCDWFKDESWSKEVKRRNIDKNESFARITVMNEARKRCLDLYYKRAKDEALELVNKYKKDPLFVAGLMLYQGEGDKNILGNSVRLSNIDLETVKIFKNFIDRFFPERAKKIRFWVLLYPDLDPLTCEEWWRNGLGLDSSQLYKYQIIQGKHKTKRLIYGVGNIIIGEKYLKVQIIELIRLLSQELLKVNYADVV